MKNRVLPALFAAGLFAWSVVAQAATLDAPPPGAFTIVVIPDTQGYDGNAAKHVPSAKTNPVLENHIRWIVGNVRAQNIVFVTHVGDITDINNHTQWRIARSFLDRLRGVVPFSLTVGNHDMEEHDGTGNASLFQRYFGADRFAEFPWYGGCYEPARADQSVSGNNVNSYQLFSAGGMDFIHLTVECNAPDDVLMWANDLLTKYSARRALISTHMDLGPIEKGKPEKGRMRWKKTHGDQGNTPEQMWEKLYRKHANLGFIFSGDQRTSTAVRLDSVGEHGNTVHALMSDYTSSGPLRLYRFIPSENRVQVITFDTTKLELVTTTHFVPDPAQHQFSLDYAMTGAAATPAK